MNKQTTLYTHEPHWHEPRNVNQAHAEEHNNAGFNQRLAVGLTRIVGTVWTAYAFALLSFVGLAGILGWLSPLTIVLVTWVSQTFLQLVFLPILSVGQSVLGKHAELQADETYSTTLRTYHDIEQIMKHLDAQDAHIMAILERLQMQETKPLESISPLALPQRKTTRKRAEE